MIYKFLDKKLIFLDEEFNSKNEALEFFSNQLKENGFVKDAQQAYELFLKRESEGSTGVGEAIAMPHIRDNVVITDVIYVAKLKTPLDWQAIDNQPIKFVFGITMTKEGGQNSHLEAISKLSSLLMNENFMKEFAATNLKQDIIDLFKKYEEVNNSKPSEDNSQKTKYDYLAVTACPTGIAHTYMAAERLQKTAKEMGISLKVETQGTQGIGNGLTDEEIHNAKGIILALDRAVDTSRFANCHNVIETSTKKAIGKPEELLKDLELNKGTKLKTIIKGDANSNNENSANQYSFDGFGKKAYRSIMTGVSYMLPFVIFGGILIAIAFLIDLIAVWSTQGLGGLSINGSNFGSINPAANWFKTIGSKAFDYMIPILAAYITFAMVGKVGILPGFIIGSMANGSANSLLVHLGAIEIIGVNSGFFGAIGGAFLTAAIIILIYKHIAPKISKNWQGLFNILIVPLFGTLAIVALFWFINIPFQYLNYGFTKFLLIFDPNNVNAKYYLWLLGLIIGLMMAFDLGGPINKAAYVFGTVSLQVNSSLGLASVPMALAIVTGMIPPLGIALSTVISKKYWTKEERESAKSNWILGLSFISEGAIPFTAAKPKVVIPANLAGGATAGIIAGAFGLASYAPHGGIFILPLFRTYYTFGSQASELVAIGIGIVGFILAIVIGTVVQALVLHFLLKKEAKKVAK